MTTVALKTNPGRPQDVELLDVVTGTFGFSIPSLRTNSKHRGTVRFSHASRAFTTITASTAVLSAHTGSPAFTTAHDAALDVLASHGVPSLHLEEDDLLFLLLASQEAPV